MGASILPWGDMGASALCQSEGGGGFQGDPCAGWGGVMGYVSQLGAFWTIWGGGGEGSKGVSPPGWGTQGGPCSVSGGGSPYLSLGAHRVISLFLYKSHGGVWP